MSRNDRKTWTLTDLKLNYWRNIHERQTKKKVAKQGGDMMNADDKDNQKRHRGRK